jgi:ABC-2 type transport system permease protein
MSANSAFEIRQGHNWSRGLDNLLRSALGSWFGMRTLLTHLLLWVGMIDGILTATLLTINNSGDPAEMASAADTGVMLYCVFTGLFAAVGVVIIMQDAIVGEKQTGTAAWVLSKPATRESFVLSKWLGNMAGIVVMMVLVPGLIAYVLISQLAVGDWMPLLPFLAGMGCLAVCLIFFQTFTLMLGALINNRGAVIGLGLALLFGQQFLANMFPIMWQVLPVGIFLPKDTGLTLAPALMLGEPLPSFAPLLFTAGFSILFLVIGVWRFKRAEL